MVPDDVLAHASQLSAVEHEACLFPSTNLVRVPGQRLRLEVPVKLSIELMVWQDDIELEVAPLRDQPFRADQFRFRVKLDVV